MRVVGGKATTTLEQRLEGGLSMAAQTQPVIFTGVLQYAPVQQVQEDASGRLCLVRETNKKTPHQSK